MATEQAQPHAAAHAAHTGLPSSVDDGPNKLLVAGLPATMTDIQVRTALTSELTRILAHVPDSMPADRHD